MKRVPFSQVLESASIDIRREYERLYGLFCLQKHEDITHGKITLRDVCSRNFLNLPFRGTCVSLDDFDEVYEQRFEPNPPHFDINYLINFCEYSYNLAVYNQGLGNGQVYLYDTKAMLIYVQQVLKVAETLGYMPNCKDGITDFVPKDQAAISVAEIVDSNLSYKVIEYNHHSMKGDLEKKKGVLLSLAHKLEPERASLKINNSSLEDDLFFLFNKINLRHNNTDPSGKQYEPIVAGMNEDELEKWYDDTYQMCLFAFLVLDNIERHNRVKQLKKDI